MLSSVQFVEKVYKAFRAKPDFNKNLKNPGTCATDFSPIDSRVSKSRAFWHEARAHESVSVSQNYVLRHAPPHSAECGFSL